MTISRLSRCVQARARLLGPGLLLLSLAACGSGADASPDAGTNADLEKPKTAACAALSAPLPAIVPDADGRAVGEPMDKAAPIYDPTVVQTFELKLADKDLAFLDANPSAEIYVQGTLVYAGKEYGPVGIRYKGSIGAWVFCVANSTPADPENTTGAKTCPKLSMKVSFNEYDSKGTFFGVKKLNFHAMNNDDSLMKERLGYGLYRQMGVPSPRAVHMRLLINGKYQGVFLNVEEIDSKFTSSHFADGKGNLYKEIWPTYIDGYTAPLTKDRLTAALQTNQSANPTFDKITAFGNAVMTAGDSRAHGVEDFMSVSNSLRFVAVDRTIRADDGPFHFYCPPGGCLNHNFYIYEEQNAARLWLIPWDLDTSFIVTGGGLGGPADDSLQIVNEWDDHTVTCAPVPGVAQGSLTQLPPSCDPLWNGLGCYFTDSYHAALSELLSGPFSESVVTTNVNTWQAQIAASVTEANMADARQLAPQDWQSALSNFVARTKFLRAQAASRLTQ